MEPTPKKPRTYNYNREWENLYLCIKAGDGAVCLLCRASFKCMKSSNIKRHYADHHATEYDAAFPVNSEARANEIRLMKSTLSKEPDIVLKPVCNDDSQSLTHLSFYVASELVKHNKAFSDGEVFKEMFKGALKIVFGEKQLEERMSTLSENVPLSRRTLSRRVQVISEDLLAQLQKDLTRCDFFSLQLDESTDKGGSAQVAVFVRMVFPDLSVREEFFKTMSIPGHATGEAIYELIKQELISSKVPICKLAGITTDGAASMTGNKNGFLSKCRNDPDFPKFNSFHCLLHQLALCAKKISVDNLMNLVVQIVNSIISKPLQNRLFNNLKEANDSSSRGLLYYTEVRWLSKGIMLERFFENLNDIVEFLKTRETEYPELHDFEWLMKLAYLVDLTQIVNRYNLAMQGPDKFIWQIIDRVSTLKDMLQSVIDNFEQNIIPFNFPRLHQIINETNRHLLNGKILADLTRKVYDEMNVRFADASSTSYVMKFLQNPIRSDFDINKLVEIITKDFHINCTDLTYEIFDLRNDSSIQLKISSGNDFWHTIAANNSYPNLLLLYKRMCSFFGTTYLCESGFSNMNRIKSLERTCLTDVNLEDCMRLSLSKYEADLKKLANTVVAQTSH